MDVLSWRGLIPASPLTLLCPSSLFLTNSPSKVGIGIKLDVNMEVLGKAEVAPGWPCLDNTIEILNWGQLSTWVWIFGYSHLKFLRPAIRCQWWVGGGPGAKGVSFLTKFWKVQNNCLLHARCHSKYVCYILSNSQKPYDLKYCPQKLSSPFYGWGNWCSSRGGTALAVPPTPSECSGQRLLKRLKQPW